MMQRNMSIEALRICLMFGIVLLHVTTQAGYFEAGGAVTRCSLNLLSPCVEGFVFLSGYFGIQLKSGKCMKLLALTFFYSALFTAPFLGWHAAWVNATHNWFLYGYLVLTLMSPALNAALEDKSPCRLLKIGLPIIFAVYGWSYLCVIPIVKDYVPTNNGFGSLSFFTMIGVYTAARLFRLLHIDEKLTARWSLIGLFVASLFILAGFHHHNSPFSLLFVVCLFALANRMVLSSALEKIIVLIAPSMFAVFLIHGTHGGHLFFKEVLRFLVEAMQIPVVVAYWLDAMAVFIGCIVLDLLRRHLFRFFKGVMK